MYSLGNKKAREVPLLVFKLMSLLGDLLKLARINFPMTSFRLKNMTTDNIQDLDETYLHLGSPPFSREMGIKLTLEWLKNE